MKGLEKNETFRKKLSYGGKKTDMDVGYTYRLKRGPMYSTPLITIFFYDNNKDSSSSY